MNNQYSDNRWSMNSTPRIISIYPNIFLITESVYQSMIRLSSPKIKKTTREYASVTFLWWPRRNRNVFRQHELNHIMKITWGLFLGTSLLLFYYRWFAYICQVIRKKKLIDNKIKSQENHIYFNLFNYFTQIPWLPTFSHILFFSISACRSGS